jgi:hypothetical protein
MDRRERRRRARELRKIEEKLNKKASQLHTEHRESQTRLRQVFEYFQTTVSGTKVLWSLVGAGLAVAAGYALFQPHVSIEPGILLNPADPFSTAFTIKNENSIFAVQNLDTICWTQSVNTSNNIRVWAPAPFERVQHTIPVLEHLARSTIDCPAVMGGLGSYTGAVLDANIEVRLSYKQTGWPWLQNERYPFKSVRDSQGGVHWIHITPAEERITAPTPIK